MTPILRSRPHRAGAVGIALASALLPWILLPADDGAEASSPPGMVLVAGTVCEAQKLRAARDGDPRLQIEIPPDYEKKFPTLEACLAHDEAWNDGLPGPHQPIPFSHKHHSGGMAMDCLYCHSGADRSSRAGVPSVEICIDCHVQFPLEYDQMEGIRILKKSWEEEKPIPWIQLHRLPEYVKFSHSRHQAAELKCQQCHGPIEKFDRLYLVPDTGWKYFVSAAKLQMGWCVQCHDANAASKDCLLCHY